MVRDLFPPAQAQRVYEPDHHLLWHRPGHCPHDWRRIHCSRQLAVHLWLPVHRHCRVYNWRLLPESLPPAKRQPFDLKNLMRGYWQLCTSLRFLLLAAASGVPFNGMFIYILSAPTFLGA